MQLHADAESGGDRPNRSHRHRLGISTLEAADGRLRGAGLSRDVRLPHPASHADRAQRRPETEIVHVATVRHGDASPIARR
jgi:hypothetical protein